MPRLRKFVLTFYENMVVSASLGMSCVAVADEVTVEHLIKQADLALYRAKDSGRDQLVVAA